VMRYFGCTLKYTGSAGFYGGGGDVYDADDPGRDDL
jgi:hypothetical protein